MKIKNIVVVSLITIILSSCAPAVKVAPTKAPISTSTPISATSTITATPTMEPTPIGGGVLKVAFYASIQNASYLIVGDYFSGKIDHKEPVRNIMTTDLSWSPDGTFLLFVDLGIKENDDMKINLLNTKTGQVSHLSTFPDGNDGQGNGLRYTQWSTDNKYVLYSPRADNSQYAQDYVASMDGIVQTMDGFYGDWLSDSEIIVDTRNGNTFDVEKNLKDPFLVDGFRGVKPEIVELTQDFIILEPHLRDRVEAIRYPENLTDSVSWDYAVLINNKVDLITFSSEIKNAEIWKLMSVIELPDHQLSIEGYGNFEAGNKIYTDFRVIVDRENTPAVVKEENLYGYQEENLFAYQVKHPAAFSPDGQLTLLGSMVQDATWYHIAFTLQDMQGHELQVDENLKQFNAITKNYVRIADLGSSRTHQFFSGIAFYWQP
ncbi:MAG: hypothetical protein K8S20_12405 [Chloroflexi bacterium]|nr:hypothetical protein [Chloroflexota bacterium]